MATQTTIAAALQDKIDAKAALKTAIETQNVPVGTIKLSDYAPKVSLIGKVQGSGQHLVTFYDFDGTVLKRERVATGGNATAPTTPVHQYLTFAEWNNPFTNVKNDIDTGALYSTENDLTYLFITLNAVTGLNITFYFTKHQANNTTIDWGDNTTSTSTTTGNQNIQHAYAAEGNYIIKISSVGTWAIGNASTTTSCFYGNTGVLTKVYNGSKTMYSGGAQFNSHRSLKYITFGSNDISVFGSQIFVNCYSLVHVNLPKQINYAATFQACYSLKSVCLKLSATSITTQGSTFYQCYSLARIIFGEAATIPGEYFSSCTNVKIFIFTPTTPPTLANINAFTGINPICKIYVPDASVDAYKTATNWVTYANYIYPLSSKPQSDE